MSPFRVKACGYGVSTLSVMLLAVAAWPTASRHWLFAVALIAGVATSIAGMGLRLFSYWLDKTRGDVPPGKP